MSIEIIDLFQLNRGFLSFMISLLVISDFGDENLRKRRRKRKRKKLGTNQRLLKWERFSKCRWPAANEMKRKGKGGLNW